VVEPVSYVKNEATAGNMAQYFANGSREPGTKPDAYFDPAGQNLLKAFLLAASLDSAPVTQVYIWLTRPHDEAPAELLRTAGYDLLSDMVMGTLFILDWLQSVELRRRVNAGLNKGAARNALAGPCSSTGSVKSETAGLNSNATAPADSTSSPPPSCSGTPSTSNGPQTTSATETRASTRPFSSTFPRSAGNTSTSPATTPGAAPPRWEQANSGRYDHSPGLSVVFFPVSEAHPIWQRLASN
jgi:hypothetical protein